jgi:ATP-dependent DNA helicase RecQ
LKRLKETQKAKYVCEFVHGRETTEMKSYKHDKEELFGQGKDKDLIFWNAVASANVW